MQSTANVDGQIRGYFGCPSLDEQTVPGLCATTGSKFIEGLETDFSKPVSDALKGEFCDFYSVGAALVSGQSLQVLELRKKYNGVCPDAACGSIKQCGACGDTGNCVWCRSSKCGIEGKGVCVAKSSGCEEEQRGCKPHCSKCPSIDNVTQCLVDSEIRKLQDNFWDTSFNCMGNEVPMWAAVMVGTLVFCFMCCSGSRRQQMVPGPRY